MCQSKKGISALQIHRQIGSGEYRTAWYMCQRFRAAMKNEEFKKLTGVVEIDETGLGGKDRNRHWDKKQHITGLSGKTTVIGAISRKGNVVCQMIENTDARRSIALSARRSADRLTLWRQTSIAATRIWTR
jgi:hypothetical protein